MAAASAASRRVGRQSTRRCSIISMDDLSPARRGWRALVAHLPLAHPSHIVAMSREYYRAHHTGLHAVGVEDIAPPAEHQTGDRYTRARDYADRADHRDHGPGRLVPRRAPARQGLPGRRHDPALEHRRDGADRSHRRPARDRPGRPARPGVAGVRAPGCPARPRSTTSPPRVSCRRRGTSRS